MKIIMTTVAAVALSLPMAAAAQQTQTTDPEAGEGLPATVHQQQTAREIRTDRFQRLDEDGSGSISTEEAQAESTLAGSFSKLDRDSDGSLSQEEFAAFESTQEAGTAMQREGMPATRHQEQAVQGDLAGQLDENGDGMVSRDEAQAEARLAENWNRYDENGDGVLDARELDRTEQELADTEEAE